MRLLISAMSLAAFALTSSVALADKCVAFVGGNSACKNVPQLPNPAIDAYSMARVQRNVGFETVEGANLARDAMTWELLEFEKISEANDVALFLHTGHGFGVNGANYLLPVDAELRTEIDVKLGATINVDITLRQTMADAKMKLVLLDVCRNNPFAAKICSATLDKNLRRDVQRRPIGLDVEATGTLDEDTRAVITRWRVARVASDDSDEPARRRSCGGGRSARGGLGHPGDFFANMTGGMFERFKLSAQETKQRG